MKMKKRYILLLILVIGCLLSYAFFIYEPKQFTGIDRNGNEYFCERGFIKVPELRTDPNSRDIKVEYVKINSSSKNPKTPIFYLAGGPGQGATGQSENKNSLSYWSSFLEDRDVVLIDQRGIGKINMLYAQLKWPNDSLFISESAAQRHIAGLATKAIKAFENRGINLNGYNSIENAHDIDAIRVSLGYEKIIPFGFSYGTHLGQSYLKYHEDKVERAILIGVEGLGETFKMPLNLDLQMDKLNKLIQADSMLAPSIPDFTLLYQKVAKQLSLEPIELEIETPIKLTRKIKIGKFGLDHILRRDMGDARDIPYLPKLLLEMEKGEYESLEFYAQKRYREFLAVPAMTMSMDLASGGSEERINRIRSQEKQSMFGNISNFPFLDLHGVWPVEDLGETFRSPPTSYVPVLLLSGDLDINTPAYQADTLAQYLSNSTHLVVKNSGHEQIMYLWDAIKTMIAFMNGENVSSVELGYEKIEFKLPKAGR